MTCTSRRLRSAWESAQADQSSLGAQWEAKDPVVLHADSDWAYRSFCWFCHAPYSRELAQFFHCFKYQGVETLEWSARIKVGRVKYSCYVVTGISVCLQWPDRKEHGVCSQANCCFIIFWYSTRTNIVPWSWCTGSRLWLMWWFWGFSFYFISLSYRTVSRSTSRWLTTTHGQYLTVRSIKAAMMLHGRRNSHILNFKGFMDCHNTFAIGNSLRIKM